MENKLILTEVILNWRPVSKDHLFKKFTNYAAEHNVIVNAPHLLKDIYTRESAGSTLIHENIALPHIKNQNIKKSMVSLIKLNNPIKKWNENNTDVYVIIFVLVKENENIEKLKQIQRIMRKLAQEDVPNLLLNGSKEEIYNLIQF